MTSWDVLDGGCPRGWFWVLICPGGISENVFSYGGGSPRDRTRVRRCQDHFRCRVFQALTLNGTCHAFHWASALIGHKPALADWQNRQRGHWLRRFHFCGPSGSSSIVLIPQVEGRLFGSRWGL